MKMTRAALSELVNARAEKWSSDESIATNAKKIGIGYASAYYLAKRNKLAYVIRKEERLRKLRLHEIVVYLREKGFALEDISRLLDCDREWVRKLEMSVT